MKKNVYSVCQYTKNCQYTWKLQAFLFSDWGQSETEKTAFYDSIAIPLKDASPTSRSITWKSNITAKLFKNCKWLSSSTSACPISWGKTLGQLKYKSHRHLSCKCSLSVNTGEILIQWVQFWWFFFFFFYKLFYRIYKLLVVISFYQGTAKTLSMAIFI